MTSCVFSYHERAEDLVAYPAFRKILPSAPYVQMAAEHRRSSRMAAITPPTIVVKMRRTPAALTDGDELAFTMWLCILPVEWLARIEAVSDTGFTGHQLCGPFTE